MLLRLGFVGCSLAFDLPDVWLVFIALGVV